MRYLKAIYVENEDEMRAVDMLLEGLRALSSCVDYDTSWEVVDDDKTDEEFKESVKRPPA